MEAFLKILADFLSGIITKITEKWIERKNLKKQGELESQNNAYKNLAQRKEKSDEIMAHPIKKGEELIDSIRARGNKHNSNN